MSAQYWLAGLLSVNGVSAENDTGSVGTVEVGGGVTGPEPATLTAPTRRQLFVPLRPLVHGAGCVRARLQREPAGRQVSGDLHRQRDRRRMAGSEPADVEASQRPDAIRGAEFEHCDGSSRPRHPGVEDHERSGQPSAVDLNGPA